MYFSGKVLPGSIPITTKKERKKLDQHIQTPVGTMQQWSYRIWDSDFKRENTLPWDL